jgi:hypothetical protein
LELERRRRGAHGLHLTNLYSSPPIKQGSERSERRSGEDVRGTGTETSPTGSDSHQPTRERERDGKWVHGGLCTCFSTRIGSGLVDKGVLL